MWLYVLIVIVIVFLTISSISIEWSKESATNVCYISSDQYLCNTVILGRQKSVEETYSEQLLIGMADLMSENIHVDPSIISLTGNYFGALVADRYALKVFEKKKKRIRKFFGMQMKLIIFQSISLAENIAKFLARIFSIAI